MMSHRAGLAFLVALVVPLLLAGGSAAANARVYHDPLGDVTCCTRDLTDVHVSNTDAGTITFAARFDDRVEGYDDDDFYLSLDTDRNPATGELGFDYVIGAHITPGYVDSVTLGKWVPSGFRTLRATGVGVSVVDHRILVKVDRHLIGDTDGFDFRLALWEVAIGHAYSELAPNTGTWFYPVKLDLRRLRPILQTTPRQPQAGRLFVARLALRVGRTHTLLASGRVLCAASVGGIALEARDHAFAGRRALCAWRIPRGARGKTLRGSVGVAVTGRSRVYRHFASKVA